MKDTMHLEKIIHIYIENDSFSKANGYWGKKPVGPELGHTLFFEYSCNYSVQLRALPNKK